MKKLLLLCSFILCSLILIAQPGVDWQLIGNATVLGQFFGTTNAMDVDIRTNSALRGTYTSLGSFQWQSCTAPAIRGFALGQNTTAGGLRSFSQGFVTTASGPNAAAFGLGTVAAGNSSAAFGGFGNAANGVFSFAIGLGNNAAGPASFSGGKLTNAVGLCSFTLGLSTVANGPQSLALGSGSITGAGGTNALAGGLNSQANAAQSFSWGSANTAAGVSSAAFGTSNITSGNNSLMFGDGNVITATGISSLCGGTLNSVSNGPGFALGEDCTTSDNLAFAFGQALVSSGLNSYTIGHTLQATAFESMVIGSGTATGFPIINTFPSSLMIGYNSDVSTIFVRDPVITGAGATGRVGIGDVTNPLAKVDILQNDLFPAAGTTALQAKNADPGTNFANPSFGLQCRVTDASNASENIAGYFAANHVPGTGGRAIIVPKDSGFVAFGIVSPFLPQALLHVGNFGDGTSVIANAYTFFSDQSLKTNVSTLQNALTTIRNLRGVGFNWISSGDHSIGFIAQEVDTVLPDIVHTDSATGLKSVDYAKIVPVLVEAMKEQQQTISTQGQLIDSILGIIGNCCDNDIDARLGHGNQGNEQEELNEPIPFKLQNSSVILYDPIPNPNRGSASIGFFIPENTGDVEIIFHDSFGRPIKSARINQRGRGSLAVDARDLANGLYTYSIVVDGEVVDTRRMVRSR